MLIANLYNIIVKKGAIHKSNIITLSFVKYNRFPLENYYSLDIFAKEKSFLNWPENLPLKYLTVISGHPVYSSCKKFCNG